MQYIKVGPVQIPYTIKTNGGEKELWFAGIKMPVFIYQKNEKTYCKIFGLSFRPPFKDKYVITQSRSNYLIKEQLDDKKIQEIATRIFKDKLGYTPDFENPRSMNEKIFWMKLNYHNSLVTTCCDKFAVKEYVDKVLGSGYVIPTIHSWEKAEDVDFSILPKQYVLKVNWSSGYNIIVKDSSTVNVKEIREKITHWMKPEQNSYYQTFNWGYKHMKPVVYAEQYMEQINGQLYDYKFYICNGKAKFLFIATERADKNTLTYDFFDMDFNRLPFNYGGRGHSKYKLERPKHYEEMLKCAEKLAEPFPFVRVDFYEVEDKFYVGEMTFYSGGGILRFDPEEWDYKLGELISLPLEECRL